MLQALFNPRTLLCLLVVVNSGFIFLTDNKLAGLPYLRELFLAGVVGAAVLLLAMWQRPWQSKASLWILFMGVVLPVLSALLAWYHFDQPVLYGLLEERRNFLYLLFFPALYLMLRAQPTQEQLERYFLIGGLACVAVGFLYYFKVIPENAAVAFNVDEKDYGLNPLRPDRFSIGGAYVSLCAMMLMYRLRRRIEVVPVLLLTLFAAYLWLVLQTRNTMLVCALAGLWIFRAHLHVLFKLGLAIIVVGGIAYMVMPDPFEAQYERLMALVAEAAEPGGVRADTTAIILRDTAANWYVGMGALSLQWQGGFASLYSSYFYLSDVGVLGVMYRYGFIMPLIVLVYFIGFWRISRQCRNKGDLLAAFTLDMCFNLINLFLSPAMMYEGNITALAIAAFVYYGQVRMPASQPADRPMERPAGPVGLLVRSGR
jgi:hypothetical protein